MLDHLLLTKQTWTLAFFLTGLQLAVVVLGGYLWLVVLFFRKRYTAIGIAFLVLCGFWYLGIIMGLIVGWWKAKRWAIQRFMVFWTATTALAVLNLALYIVMRLMTLDEWLQYFDWLPDF